MNRKDMLNIYDILLKLEGWRFDRGLIGKDYAQMQLLKLGEEYGETAGAFIKGKEEELQKEIGA